MDFNKISMDNWKRKDSFFCYFDTTPCTYSMTVNFDITCFLAQTKLAQVKFFPSFLYALAHTVNRRKEFRMDIDEDRNIGYYSYLNPYYTVFHEETETITNVWTEYSDNIEGFMQNYFFDMSQYRGDYRNSKPLIHKNIFHVSCIPWATFTGFNLNLQKGYEYLLPIFTIGKYFSNGDTILLPMAIQVHHAVCDGFHLAKFVNDLQDYLTRVTE